jgi:hypothetical protein
MERGKADSHLPALSHRRCNVALIARSSNAASLSGICCGWEVMVDGVRAFSMMESSGFGDIFDVGGAARAAGESG